MLKQIVSMTLLSVNLFTTALNELVPAKNIKGTTYLVNRDHPISKDYVPQTLKAQVPGSSRLMRADGAKALEEMFAAAKEEANITFTTTSGYRSFSRQKTIYQNKLNKVGTAEKANEYVAPAGASEHQLGLAMDLGAKGVAVGLNSKFGDTKPGKWVAENAHRFGFIIRYQHSWEEVTGYKYEPWHIRYVGVEHALRMYEGKIPMEKYMEEYSKEQLLYYLRWEGDMNRE